MTHKLVDGVAKNREQPKTFNIPTDQEKALIGPGDFVKFAFKLRKPIKNFTTERLWVEVWYVSNGTIAGVLANEPVMLKAKLGDEVKGELRNVLDIHQPKKRSLQ
jgi:uncharacterized protein YegJ (DUF2314 family)